MSKRSVFLIDGTAFCYRAFYAIQELNAPDGRPTNAVFGFFSMLNAIRQKLEPEYLAVAFDLAEPTFRHEEFEDYKAQREPMPDPLIEQIPLVKEILRAYRIPIFECQGYEGEDVLATVMNQIRQEPDLDIFIATGDKDVLQLVDERVRVYNPYRKDADPVIDAAAVEARYGIRPDQMIDFLALTGDAVDNIPGVPGIGPKTAQKLLNQFETIEGIYEHIAEISSRSQREKLKTHKQDALLSRKLAKINAEAPLKVKLKDIEFAEPDIEALRRLFKELDFRRWLRELPGASAGSKKAGSVQFISDSKAFGQAIKQIDAKRPASLALFPFSNADGALLVLGNDPYFAGIIDSDFFQSADGKALKNWLEDPRIEKIGHDTKMVYRRLHAMQVSLQGIAGDTSIAAYVLDSSRASPVLEDLIEHYLDQSVSAMELPEPPFDDEKTELLSAAVSPRISILADLFEKLSSSIKAEGLESVYHEIEHPLIAVLAKMECRGIALDIQCLETLQQQVKEQLEEISAKIEQLADQPFNPKSPKQLAKVLFEDLGLPVIKRTKTGPSTNSEVLRRLAQQHPLPGLVIEFRELAKLLSTYIEALPKLVNQSTGRLHTHLDQTGTTTGRLSSRDPNLQNIPVKTELGRSIRKAFVPGIADGLLISADYSQIELRILAHVSSDPALIEAFRRDADIHRYTASLIYGIDESEVSPEQRSAMKAVNFGVLYGMGAHGLSAQLDISFGEAQEFIDAYFDRYAKVRAYLDAQIESARTLGYVETLYGRRRHIPEVRGRQVHLRQFGERMAINAPIQGTAADLIKMAMIRLDRALEAFSSRILLQVHDDLLIEGPASERAAVVALIRKEMENVAKLAVPLRVSVKVGKNWLEMEPVT